MLNRANRIPLSPPPANEISTGGLLSLVADYPQSALVFSYDGRDVSPGYHVTEVKHGYFEGLDCGGNPEAWRETFIQLWDVSEEPREHMLARKFSAILAKVAEATPFDPYAKLTFEVSDGFGAIQLFRAEAVIADDGIIRVTLSRRPASCKPRDRWLEDQKVADCCGSAAEKAPCCG